MTKNSLFTGAVSLLIAASYSLAIVARADDEPKSPLAVQMDGIAKDFRSLHKIINDPAQKDAAVGLVKDMEDRATKAKSFEPIKTKDIPADQKDQFLADYRKQIDGLIGDFQTLEQDISAGKTSDASAMLDKISTDKREGHKKFNAEK